MKKIARFLVDVKKEMSKVVWPTKKDMVTYTTAVLTFMIIFSIFFSLTDLLLAGLKMVTK